MPVLSAMGTVLRTGAVGSGQAMKALNNLVSTGGFLIGIEALLIGQRKSGRRLCHECVARIRAGQDFR